MASGQRHASSESALFNNYKILCSSKHGTIFFAHEFENYQLFFLVPYDKENQHLSMVSALLFSFIEKYERAISFIITKNFDKTQKLTKSRKNKVKYLDI